MQIKFRCLPELEPHLLRPVKAASGLPDWLKDMPSSAASDVLDGAEVRTLKHCAPLLDAMQTGMLFPLACDVQVRAGEFSWDWNLPRNPSSRQTRSPIGVHMPEQAEGMPGAGDADNFLIKFNNFWTIATPPGVSLLIVHPLNRPDLPFHTFSGIVDCDSYTSGFVHFPARWTDADFAGVLPRGTPVAQAIPFRREALEPDFAEMSAQELADHGYEQDALQADPGHYRKHRRVKRTRVMSE